MYMQLVSFGLRAVGGEVCYDNCVKSHLLAIDSITQQTRNRNMISIHECVCVGDYADVGVVDGKLKYQLQYSGLFLCGVKLCYFGGEPKSRNCPLMNVRIFVIGRMQSGVATNITITKNIFVGHLKCFMKITPAKIIPKTVNDHRWFYCFR